MTELSQCERCPDKWLQEVQEEIKLGSLSVDNHAFLHGQPTSVAGSYTRGYNSCGSVHCTSTLECDVCQTERKARQLVALTPSDPRFKHQQFLEARAVFANNDVKFDVNKRRARTFARDRNESVTWIKANDQPCQSILAEHANITEQKLKWLQRHDRDCGNLYGMFPLIQGMPVALTDHVDRKKGRLLLRGRLGKIHSWILSTGEQSIFRDGVRILDQMPRAIIVKFSDSKWRLPSMPEPGLYPIRPKKKTWWLDKQRPSPLLKVSRTQFPLAPGFAITAHASQGQTLDSAIVDLCLPDEASAVTAYVAMTRVRTKESLLIYRPFQRARFAQGQPDGPQLLLEKLRGETLDWARIQDTHAPNKLCSKCFDIYVREDFTADQWSRTISATCKRCVNDLRRRELLECSICYEWQSCARFQSRELKSRNKTCNTCRDLLDSHRLQSEQLCLECGRCLTRLECARNYKNEYRQLCHLCESEQQYTCTVCKQHLTHRDFSRYQLRQQLRTCRTCSTPSVKTWKCSKCQNTLERTAFGKSQEGKPEKTCRACVHPDTSATAWVCIRCTRQLDREAFSAKQQQRTPRTCQDCITKIENDSLEKAWFCVRCQRQRQRQDFSTKQQSRKRKVCSSCMPSQEEETRTSQRQEQDERTYACSVCFRLLTRDHFSDHQLKQKNKLCVTCITANQQSREQPATDISQPCSKCKRNLGSDCFSARQWKQASRTCRECTKPSTPNWTCSKCKQVLGREAFSASQSKRASKTCTSCANRTTEKRSKVTLTRTFTCSECSCQKEESAFDARHLHARKKICQSCESLLCPVSGTNRTAKPLAAKERPRRQKKSSA